MSIRLNTRWARTSKRRVEATRAATGHSFSFQMLRFAVRHPLLTLDALFDVIDHPSVFL